MHLLHRASLTFTEKLSILWMLLQNGFGIQFPYPEKVHGGKTLKISWLNQVSANQIQGVLILLAAELKTTIDLSVLQKK